MKLLYVTSEAYPFCKTGGLADVAGSLPPALAAEGVETAVILPLYDKIGPQWREKMTFRRYIYVDLHPDGSGGSAWPHSGRSCRRHSRPPPAGGGPDRR